MSEKIPEKNKREGVCYTWSEPDTLRKVCAAFEYGAVVLGSSEGGLFENATDEEICANLHLLCDCTPDDCAMVGPVVRYLGLEHFGSLAESAGWKIECYEDGSMHQVVRLRKAA